MHSDGLEGLSGHAGNRRAQDEMLAVLFDLELLLPIGEFAGLRWRCMPVSGILTA